MCWLFKLMQVIKNLSAIKKDIYTYISKKKFKNFAATIESIFVYNNNSYATDRA